MKTLNDIRADILAEVALEGIDADLHDLLNELVFASRALALKTSADAMYAIADAGAPAHASGWRRAANWLEGREADA